MDKTDCFMVGSRNNKRFIVVSAIEYLVNNDIVKTAESKDDRFIEKYKAWVKKEIQKYKGYSENLNQNISELNTKIFNMR